MVIEWLGFGDNYLGARDRARARRCITNLWQEMYLAMLSEFDRDAPIRAVSKYLHSGASIADYLRLGTLKKNQLKNPMLASHPPAPVDDKEDQLKNPVLASHLPVPVND